jgi:hypothetical protein
VGFAASTRRMTPHIKRTNCTQKIKWVLQLIFPFREERKGKGEERMKEEETRPSHWFADPQPT